MSVDQPIAPNAKTLFESIIRPRLPRHDRPWSTAELNLTEGEYRQIAEWFANFSDFDSEATATPAASSTRASLTEAGLLIIALFAECARRHAEETTLWSSISRLPIKPGLRHSFFTSIGQPTAKLKQLIESTAYHWNLRHVFDIPGHLAWFITIYLQIGFTKWGMERRLPFWLSGQMHPVAVSYLLSGGEMGSQSFWLLWQTLRAYRLNQAGESMCRHALENSPWICEEWIPDLLKQAKMRLDLIERSGLEGAEDLDPLMLGYPKLVWPENGDPHFSCEILAATTFELEAPCYEIRSAAFEVIRLVRQEDGTYYVTGDSYVTIPFGVASLQCTLVELSPASGETDRATQAVSLWDRHYPISLYQKNNGSKIKDPESPARLDQGCYAIFHQSFTVTPPPQRSFQDGNWWMVQLPACQGDDLALLQEGERVWWPESPVPVGEEPHHVEVYPSSNEVLRWINPKDVPELSFYVRVPKEATLSWVRIGHQPLEFNEAGDLRYLTGRFTIRPEHLVHPLYAAVGFTVGGKRHRSQLRVHLKAQACILEYDANLSVYDPNKSLNLRNARRFLFHIVTPTVEGAGARRTCLLEGSRFLKRVTTRAIQLSDLAGYGAPIEIYEGLYNTQERLATLVARVRDMGVIKRIKFNSEGFDFLTASKIEISAEHQLIAWTTDHQFIELPIAHLKPQEEDDHWFYDLGDILNAEDGEDAELSIKAIGFFYQGHRLGSWFDLKFHYAITTIKTSEEAEVCAEMLRWFKAPILDDERQSSMGYLLGKFMGAVMPVWLAKDTSPIRKLAPLPVDDEWLHTVSSLGRGIRLTAFTIADASLIIEAVDPTFDPKDILTAFPESLAKLDGLNASLIAKIAHLYLKDLTHLSLGVNAAMLKSAILKKFEFSDTEFEKLCGKLGVDENFVRLTLEKSTRDPNPSELDRHNHELLLRHRLIRKMLTRLYILALKT